MRLSPAFDNTAPASVTPSRGAAFDNTAWVQLRYQSKANFEASVRPTWSPANATAATVNGWVIAGGSTTAFCDSSASGSFSGIANSNTATLFSVAITPQTVYPLLLATCGGFSFYAATAGVSCGPTPYVTVAGSAFITGPNGYTSTGYFRYAVGLDPEDEVNPFQQPFDFIELQVYAQETGLTAQPSNTAASTSSKIPRAELKLYSPFVFPAMPNPNLLPEVKFQSQVQFSVSQANLVSYVSGGFSIQTAAPNATAGTKTGTFAALTNATLHGMALTGEHTFPILLGTAGGFTFRATNAGNYTGDFNTFYGYIYFSGSVAISGPNNYNAVGFFKWTVGRALYALGTSGPPLPGAPITLEIWANETDRFLAQPTNTAPEARL